MAGPIVEASDSATMENGSNGVTSENTASGTQSPLAAGLAPPTFDLSRRKKKKKSKLVESTEDELAANVAATSLTDGVNGEAVEKHETVDFALPDFTGKKKKKKKKVFFEDDVGDLAGGDAGASDRQSRRQSVPQPWDGSDRDYTYSELINRAFEFLHGKNPSLAAGSTGQRRISLQHPQVAREGTKKTVFLNFGAICRSIHRQQEHFLAYMGAELGTTGSIQDGGRLVIKGRFTAEAIAKVLRKYMMEYVICRSCRSPDTVLMRDANTRLFFVSCESCGAKRSVAPIRQGFMAQVERRKKT